MNKNLTLENIACHNIYNTMLKTTNDAFLLLDDKGKILDANKNYCNFSGYTLNELKKKSIFEIQNNTSNDFLEKILSKTQNNPWSYTEEHKNKNGEFWEADVSISSINENKQLKYVLFLKNNEKTKNLLKIKTTYVSIAETTDDAIISKTIDGIITTWNNGAENLFGYSKKEVIGKHISILVPENKKEEENLFLKTISENKHINQFETERLNKNGQTISVSINIFPIYDKENNLAEIGSIIRDISENMKLISELKRTDEILKSILDNIPMGVFWKDTNCNYLGINKQAAKDSGLKTTEDVVGLTDDNLSWRVFAEKYRADDHEVMKSDIPKINIEEKLQLPGGKYQWVRTNKIPLKNINNSIYGILGTYEDITDRKVNELELIQKNKDLEYLIYILSHDLREPLRSIRSFSKMVLDRYSEKLDEKGNDFLQRVVNAGNRLDNLLDQILIVSRVQRANKTDNIIELRTIINDVLNDYSDTLKKVNGVVEVSGEFGTIKGDSLWIKQAISNLINNAIKFVEKGQAPQIQITSYKDNNDVEGLVIKDRGIGVSGDNIELIFQLFRRGVDKSYEGTGAGLAIVKQVAEKFGGKAWAKNRNGGGLEVYVTFGK